MFEKEAEEYAIKSYGNDAFTQAHIPQMIEPVRMYLKNGFQKGAEFGYNKANEWHYVKDGDLPKNENSVLLYTCVNDYNVGQFCRGRFWCNDCGWFETDEIIAWKEIVLPKEDK